MGSGALSKGIRHDYRRGEPLPPKSPQHIGVGNDRCVFNAHCGVPRERGGTK
jgi:hypothetical protein